MRKFFAVLMAVVAMVAGVACSDEGGINGGEDKSVFDIKIYEITAVGADVEIAPIDYEGAYYFDALNEESYNYFKIAGFQKFIDNEVSKRMVTYNISKSEALESMLSDSFGESGGEQMAKSTRPSSSARIRSRRSIYSRETLLPGKSCM